MMAALATGADSKEVSETLAADLSQALQFLGGESSGSEEDSSDDECDVNKTLRSLHVSLTPPSSPQKSM